VKLAVSVYIFQRLNCLAAAQWGAHSSEIDDSICYGTGGLALSFCGAILFAASVAPTHEFLRIGIQTHPVFATDRRRCAGIQRISARVIGNQLP